MTPEEVLIALTRTSKVVPREALHAATLHREVLKPRLLTCLVEVIMNPKLLADDPDLQLPFYAMYLLAAWREHNAHPLLLGFLRLPGEQALDLSGDIVTEDMSRLLAQTCGGDVRGILALVRDPAVNEYARNAGVRALALLTKWGELPRETLVVNLRETMAAVPPADTVLSEIVCSALDLQLIEMRDELLALFDDGQIDEGTVSRQEVAEEFDHPLATHFRHPIEDVAAEVHWWGCFERERPPRPSPPSWPEPPAEAPVAAPIDATPPVPYRAPPKPGRNDPCPCGSGKKYKKCCGA
jgi:hypothetical protein